MRRFEDAGSDFTYDDSGLEQTSSILDHHNTNFSNEIAGRTYYDPGKTLLGETTPFIYDAAGNLVDDDEHQYVYDAWNRLVKVNTISKNRQGEKSYGALVAYAYDALGRRVARYDEEADTADYFHYDGNRVVEEWHDDDTDNQFNVAARRRQYVWGLDYIDELVEQTNGPATSSTDYFVHQDANYNVVALTLAEDVSPSGPLAGALVEQYSYEPYGEPFAVENGGGEVLPSGVPSTNIGHQGLWREFLVDFYHNRARTYFFKLGRFGQRHPRKAATPWRASLARNARALRVRILLGAVDQYQDGMHLYQYAMGTPVVRLDAGGLWTLEVHESITGDAFDRGFSCKPNLKDRGLFRDGLLKGAVYPDIPPAKLAVGAACLVPTWLPTEVGRGIKFWKEQMSPSGSSHWGVNQYWHAMAWDERTAQELRDKVIQRVMELYGKYADGNDEEQMGHAIGEALHTIQDSYTRSHVIRNEAGQITWFQQYAKQKGSKHKQADEREGNEEQYDQALEATHDLLELILCGTGEDSIKKLLEDEIMVVAPGAQVGGSHPDFKK